jgi:hypothetical protein
MQSVSTVEPGTNNNGKLPYIDLQRCKDREDRAVAVRIHALCFASPLQVRFFACCSIART